MQQYKEIWYFKSTFGRLLVTILRDINDWKNLSARKTLVLRF
jgi:hypothetical protein